MRRPPATSLEAAYQGDPFQSSLLTKNLLQVLDELENEFETITDGRIVMKLHKSEVGVMREHALPLAKEALAALEKRYNFTAQGPLLIEMFPKHDGFAVRTLGLPGHDWRAWRLLRTRRHARFAQGAAAW